MQFIRNIIKFFTSKKAKTKYIHIDRTKGVGIKYIDFSRYYVVDVDYIIGRGNFGEEESEE